METTYLTPGPLTGMGTHAAAVSRLPGDFASLARIVQGLLIHEFWADAYGVAITPMTRDSVHLRPVPAILDEVLAVDDRPFDVPREPDQRVASNCRGFTTVAVALLRAHGVPARARCGFGAYFEAGWFEDHWVVEWHDGSRWRRGDPQIDDLQRKALGIDFDLGDLGDRFVVAGEAWRRCRAGEADPATFGLSTIKESGLDWIAGNVFRDAAALGGVEVLPWDTWPAMAAAPSHIDEIAAGRVPVTVPDQVHNELRQRSEPLTSGL